MRVLPVAEAWSPPCVLSALSWGGGLFCGEEPASRARLLRGVFGVRVLAAAALLGRSVGLLLVISRLVLALAESENKVRVEIRED